MNVPLSFQHKIVSRARLLEITARAKRERRTVVQCHGCFDIVHPGHIRYLEFARRQGDVLLASLTGDANVTKGNQRPYIPQELRAENLAALECVDLVYIDPNPTAERILGEVKPDIYVKGREYELSEDPRFLAERQIVERNGGRVIFSSGEIVFSSTKIIDAITEQPAIELERGRVFCRRHDLSVESLSNTVDGFQSLRVLVVGDTVMDQYVFCDAVDVASEAPMLALKQIDRREFVGGAAIVARHVAAMGASAALLTAAGTDAASTSLENVLHAEGVRSHMIRCRPSLVQKTRYLVDDAKLLKVEQGDRVPLDSLAERQALSVVADHAPSVDVVIFCDFGFGMISESFVDKIMALWGRRRPVLTADVSGARANLLAFRNADLLCPTERELRSNLNDYDSGLSAAAYDLLTQTQARHLIVTLEKKGLVTFARQGQAPGLSDWNARLISEHLPSFANLRVDRLGAGDALLAAASLALGGGRSLTHAAYIGNAAAALEIERLGNIPVSRDDLRRWIDSRSELRRPRQKEIRDSLVDSDPPTTTDPRLLPTA